MIIGEQFFPKNIKRATVINITNVKHSDLSDIGDFHVQEEILRSIIQFLKK
jgi:hypothetical protein